MLHVNDHISIPRDELSFTYVRSSGPGGQNVNKTASKAVMRWDVAGTPSLPEDVRFRFQQRYANRLTQTGELVLTSQRYRDQLRNIDDCLAKLADMVREVYEPPIERKARKPSRRAAKRRVEEKRRISSKKQQRRSLGGE